MSWRLLNTKAQDRSDAPALAASPGRTLLPSRLRERAECRDDRFEGRRRAALMRIERAAHRGKMGRRGSATTADDARARVVGEASVFGHEGWGAGVMDMGAPPLGNAGIGLGDDHGSLAAG